MSDWGAPQYDSYSSGRKRGREEEEDYHGDSYRGQQPGYQRRRYNNPYHNDPRGGHWGRDARYSEDSPYYGSRYDNVMRIKQDLWKMLEPEGSRFKSHENTSKRHGLSTEQYESIRKALEENWLKHEQSKLDVLTVFAVAVSELPHKHTYFATFLALLHAKPVLPAASSHSDSASKPERGLDKDEKDDAPASESKEDPEPAKDPEPPLNIALHVLQHLDSNLGVAVSQSDWRSVRFHLRFFALCAASLPNAMVDPDSLTNALGQLVDILKRSNVVLAVKDDVAKAVGETLLLLPLEDRNTPFRQALKEYQATRQLEEAHLILGPNRVDHIHALCDLVLIPTEESPFVHPLKELPDLLDRIPDAPSVKLASLEESISMSELKTTSTPRMHLRFFDDETTPGLTSGVGYLVRGAILDLMELLEPNRKECARILLELSQGHWIVGNEKLFKAKKSKDQQQQSETAMEVDAPKGTWILDNTLVELLLSSLFATPSPPFPTIYYTSLLVELCKLSPTTVAPAMGKCVRRSYAGLGAKPDESQTITLDGEGLRRFAEWFGVHLSNFNFTWRWPEWQGDLSLPASHPKRVLIDRILELEVRLSYFDRIKDTLPDTYKESLPLFQGQAPMLVSVYEQKDNPHSGHAETVADMLRGKAPVDEINDKSAAFISSATNDSTTEAEAISLNEDIITQALLQIGSKSFSHFLNILERYLQLFKALASTSEKRRSLINTVWTFFSSQKQMGIIVLDKLLRYRVLDPKDVVAYIFDIDPVAWSDINTWDLLTNTIDVAQSRIANALTKLDSLRAAAAVKAAEDEEQKQSAATDGNTVNGTSVKPDATSSDEIRTLEQQVTKLEDSLSVILLQAAKGFADMLSKAEDEWVQWWARSWTKQFARQYAARVQSVDGIQELLQGNGEANKLFTAALQWNKHEYAKV